MANKVMANFSNNDARGSDRDKYMPSASVLGSTRDFANDDGGGVTVWLLADDRP